MSDRVFLAGLVVETLIGVHDYERRAPRALELDLELPCDAAAAAESDRLAAALDYDRLAAEVRTFAEEARFQLIETFADRLAEHLLSRLALPWIRIEVRKPGAVSGCRAVGVRIERRRRVASD